MGLMSLVFAYICHEIKANVSKYTLHGSYGYGQYNDNCPKKSPDLIQGL